jgi:hypothetical protein
MDNVAGDDCTQRSNVTSEKVAAELAAEEHLKELEDS